MSAKTELGGQMIAGIVFLFLGLVSLWKGCLALVYHMPIYFKGPSWMSPFQALIAGGLCLAFGLFLVVNAYQKRGSK
jgi:hypothetical protein